MNDYKEIDWNDYNNLSSKKGKYKVIEYYPNGNIFYKRYRINNKFHREDGPAYIEYHKNGNIWREQYFINDKPHREDGPAYVSYYENGNVYNEGYYINDKCHRENGPAYVRYNKNVNIDYEKYYLCDKYFAKKEYYTPKIQAILDIVKMMDTWENKLNFIKLSLKKHL